MHSRCECSEDTRAGEELTLVRGPQDAMGEFVTEQSTELVVIERSVQNDAGSIAGTNYKAALIPARSSAG